MSEQLASYQQQLSSMSAQEMLSWALLTFGRKNVVLASSLGAEDQVLTDMILSLDVKSRVFTLDTGRVFQESYDVMQASMERYRFSYEVCVPEAQAVAELIAEDGPNLFYKSVEQRKRCCAVRKIEPLKKILATADIWITGLRAEQSVTRTDLAPIEWDASHQLFKLNPLWAWSESDVWAYIKEKSVPYNALHDKGFPSIGCAPCTRAVKPGEDVRAGRWWWEQPEQKECGLHFKDGQLVRKKGDAL